MTDRAAPKTTFLPNLVGGISIWKLARDLNEEKFFDRRLLVPETEGSDSLPVMVRWKLEGLLPLKEARGRFSEDAQKAVDDFLACVKNVAKEFDDPKSGYSKYKQALTVPALDAEADNYFFDPSTKKLMVINWGASPRALGGKEEFVFGYGSFDKLFAGAAVAGTAGAVAGAAGAAVAPAAPTEAKPEEKKDDKKDEKKDKKPGALLWGRPWWVWLLIALAIAALLLLILFLLGQCQPPWEHGADAGPDAALDGGADAASEAGADAAADASDDAGDAGEDAAASDGGDDAGKDAGADAGDGGKDAGADAGKDAGKDGGDASGDGDDGPGGPGGPGGVGIGIGGGGGKIRVVPGGPLVPIDALPHRAHFHPDAVRWKVASGEQFLAAGSPKTGEGQHFDVVLKPGNTFEQVTVLWQDRKGVWHQ